MHIPLRLLFLVLSGFFITVVSGQAYPVVTTYGSLSRIDGLSQRYDYLTGDYHLAWHDPAAGAVQYRRITPSGTVVTPHPGPVDTSEDPGEFYSVTAVTFDDLSRPVVAYTKLSAGVNSINVARWNGTAWIRTTVASYIQCSALSLDLFQRQSTNWRLAYVNYAGRSLHLASAGGGDIKVMDYTELPTDYGINLYYSANSGSLAWRVPGEALHFGNTADNGSGITAVINQEATSLTGDSGVHVSRAYNAPGGRLFFVHCDAVTSDVLLTSRDANFNWHTEIVGRVINPDATNAFPSINFDPEGNPVVVWSQPTSGTLHFAAKIGGTWSGDSLSTNGFLLREAPFLTMLPAGGFHIHSVSQRFTDLNQQALWNFGPIDDFTDADRDGVPVRLERAFMMNTTQADRNRLPQLGTAVIGGQPRITLTVRQQPGGTALGTYGYEAGDYQMLIQTSRDLASWDTRTLPLGIAESFTVSGTRFTTYYLQDPPGTPNGYCFMRVKVNRL